MLLSSRLFRPGIAQADDSVEHGCTRTAVHLISEEVPGTLKLEACTGRGLPDKRLNLGVTDEMDRLLVDIVQVVTRIRAGHGALEQSVVQTHGDGVRVPCGYPVNRALDLAAIHRIATPRLGIVPGVDLDHVTCVVFDDVRARDQIRVAQPDFAAGEPCDCGDDPANPATGCAAPAWERWGPTRMNGSRWRC